MGNDVASDRPLMDAGVDSLAASELVQQLSDEFTLELPTTLLFDHPSVASISSHVALVAVHVGTIEREMSLVEEI